MKSRKKLATVQEDSRPKVRFSFNPQLRSRRGTNQVRNGRPVKGVLKTSQVELDIINTK